MKVVVVDDERKIRRGLVKRIEAHGGWQVAGAFETGREALSFLLAHPADVVVTDIRMPGLSGLELISSIREIGRELQIIILSGYGEFAYAQRAIELGVRRFLTKPTNVAELIAALEEAEWELRRRDTGSRSADIVGDLREPAAPTGAAPPAPFPQKMSANLPDSSAPAVSNFAAAEVVAYIRRNYASKITLHDMSETLCLSPNYLCRLFKRHMGRGPMEYLAEYRMELAKRHLKEARYSISDIAAMVGYSDPGYFSSAFKKAFGVTPLEFRNKNHEK